MAERKDGEEPGSEAPAPEIRDELPKVDAPSLSPAAETPAQAPAAAEAPAPELVVDAADAIAATPRTQQPWHHRQSLIAAGMVVLAAGIGAMLGAVASSVWSPSHHDVAALEERKAMQQSIAHLTKQVSLLKSNLEKVSKAEHARIARMAERPDTAAEITGSIPKLAEAVPVPLPRPAPRIAAAQTRPPVVPGWSIRDVRDGFVYVQNQGDIYQVVPGAPLPGLGAVQGIGRRDGRWVVVTPRGLIVAQRDRRFFE